MYDVRLSDGTWVTTPMWAGFGAVKAECPSEEHQWEAHGPSRPPEQPGEVPIQMERCSRCGWVRGRYLENPHPGVEV
jgi:hypothetical protein